MPLQSRILSHRHNLRLNALQFLALDVVDKPAAVSEVLNRCLHGERISLDVSGVRDRIVWIGKVGEAAMIGAVEADICARWLIGMLLGCDSF